MGKEENSLLGESSSKSTTDEVLDTLCPKLSYTERLYGFCIASAIGWLISFASFISFFKGETTRFAIIFTIGNIVCVGGTCFLAGPKSQTKKMIAPQRWISTIIFFGSMAFTIVCALLIKIKLLTLFSALVQFCAYIWYSLSFIPYGQKMLKKTCASCCDL